MILSVYAHEIGEGANSSKTALTDKLNEPAVHSPDQIDPHVRLGLNVVYVVPTLNVLGYI